MLSSYSRFIYSHKAVTDKIVEAIGYATSLANVIHQTAAEKKEYADKYGSGLDYAAIKLVVPIFLHLETTLECKVILEGAPANLVCQLIWYINDEVVLEERVITGQELPVLTYDFEYVPDMANEADIRVILRYITQDGDIQEITDEKSVFVENHSKEHWAELEFQRVLELVDSTYYGDRTLEWALENDFDETTKLIFVNGSGDDFKSDTEFLVWVDRKYQRMNIFTGSAGNWELIETFIIATGGPGTRTHRGVTTISSRSRVGWGFDDFRVYPVVRFFPERPESYAFHSRPKELGSQNFTDDRIGFPVSAGCIRMYDEDIWFLFNEIPDGTTVVIQ